MDRVRLGRVLGRGARMAARTVADAVDAATTPTPSGATPVRQVALPASSQRRTAAAHTAVGHAIKTAGQVHESVHAARGKMLDPVKRASRAVTLEITGSFFALFALSFGIAVWRLRGAWHGGEGVQRLWLYAALGALFLYFAVSNFLLARRLSQP